MMRADCINKVLTLGWAVARSCILYRYPFVSGEDAYRPEFYGNSITIVRNVTASGSMSYKIKDNRGRVVCDKKVREELDRILESFSIQVDNPIAVSYIKSWRYISITKWARHQLVSLSTATRYILPIFFAL